MWLPLVCPLLGAWPATHAYALGWESNQGPFGSQAGTQTTEPYHPGPVLSTSKFSWNYFFFSTNSEFTVFFSYPHPVPHLFMLFFYFHYKGFITFEFFEMNKVSSNHKVSNFKIFISTINWMFGFHALHTFP